MSEYKELSCLAYDLRKKVVEMVVSGKGGHIGGDMSVIDVLVALYFKEMNISPENMDDPDRDRLDRKSTRLNSSHKTESRMPSSA